MNDEWTWRHRVAYRIHRLGYRLCAPEEHELVLKDGDGAEIFSVAFTGGFVASHPPADTEYTLWCRHFDGDDDLVGTLDEL